MRRLIGAGLIMLAMPQSGLQADAGNATKRYFAILRHGGSTVRLSTAVPIQRLYRHGDREIFFYTDPGPRQGRTTFHLFVKKEGNVLLDYGTSDCDRYWIRHGAIYCTAWFLRKAIYRLPLSDLFDGWPLLIGGDFCCPTYRGKPYRPQGPQPASVYPEALAYCTNEPG